MSPGLLLKEHKEILKSGFPISFSQFHNMSTNYKKCKLENLRIFVYSVFG